MLHSLSIPAPSTGGGGTTSGAFCELYQDGSDWFIRGGLVQAGETNHAVEDYAVSVAADGDWRIYVEVDVECNRDDDDQYFLPGIANSPGSVPDIEKTASATYPANDAPAVADGLGTIILPLGVLTVESGEPSFAPTGCGSFFLSQCAGNLGYSRA